MPNIELRAFWETKIAKLNRNLENAEAQLQTQREAVGSEMDAVQHAQERLDLALSKAALAENAVLEIQREIEVVRETIEALKGGGDEGGHGHG